MNIMHKRGKVWGTTQSLFNKNNVEIHRITCKSGGYCSKHKHVHKFNAFFVERGLLEITIYRWDSNKQIEDKTVLTAGQSTFVEPGLFHKFKVLEEDTVALEIYWVDLSEDDIVRDGVGGIS